MAEVIVLDKSGTRIKMVGVVGVDKAGGIDATEQGKIAQTLSDVDKDKIGNITVDGYALSSTELSGVKAKIAAPKKDPAADPAARFQGTLTIKVGDKTYTIGKGNGYSSTSKGKIDGADRRLAIKLARAEIAKHKNEIGKANKTFEVTIDEDEVDESTIKGKGVFKDDIVPKKAPPKDAPAPDTSGDADEPKDVDAPGGDADKPAKSAIVDVDVTIKDGKKTKTVKVSYKSDGKPGISKADAESFVKAYESTVDTDKRDKQADVTIEGQTVKVGKIYTIAEQADEEPVKDAGATAKPGAGDADLDPSSTYIYRPTQANKARLDAEKADSDALIAALLAALFGGNLDALPSIFNALAQKTGMTVAEVAAKTAEALGMADKEAAEFGEKMAAFTKDSSDPKKRAEASGELQKLQILMQQNNNRRDQFMNLLRTTLSLNDTMKNANDSVLGWKEKESSHYRWA